MKKSLIFWFAAVTCAAWILVGCESPTDGTAGAAGAPGPIYLSGPQTTAGIQAAIDSGAPLVFAGVAQSDVGTVIVPAGRGVKLVGDDAYKVENTAASFLILGDASSVSGTGVINAQANGNVIGPQAVLDASVTGGSKLAYQAIGTDGAITFTANKAAVNGNVTIATAGVTGTTIPAASLTGKTLYVVGGLTVSNAVTATEISVVGDVTAAATITGGLSATGKVTFSTAPQTALTELNAGSVESAVAISTTSDGAINVDGELKTTGTSSHVTVDGSGTLTAGSLNLAGNLTVGTATTGAVMVNGAATIGGTVTTGAAAAELTFGGATTISGAVTPGAAAAVFTFNGPTTIAETFTPGAPSTIIGGTGAVTFAKALGSTATNTVIIKNTGGVTLTAANTIAAAIKATNVTIIGSSTGVTIDSDATDLTTTNGSVKVVETGAKIEAGGSTGKVTITGATLEGGTFTATDSDTATLTLGAGAVLTVEVTGAVTIGTAGQIVLTDGTSIIALVEGGSLAAPAAGGLIKNGGDATGVKLTVADKSEPETETYATVTDASPFIVTTATATGSGTQKVIVGKISWTIDKTGEVNAQAGATESGTIGTLKAGAGTVLLIDAST